MDKKCCFINIPITNDNNIYDYLKLHPITDDDNNNTNNDIILENHQRLKVLESKYDLKDKFVFTFVSHPYTRIINWYKSHQHIEPYCSQTLNEWIHNGCQTHWNIQNKTDWKGENVSPLLQYNFINGEKKIDFIGKTENYEQDCKQLIEQLNKIEIIINSENNIYDIHDKIIMENSYIDSKSMNIIQNLFKIDFMYFKYNIKCNEYKNIYLSNKCYAYWLQKVVGNRYDCFNDTQKFINYFLSFINNSYENKIYKIHGVFNTLIEDNIQKSKNKINILLCHENCDVWKHFPFINKYGYFGNDNIQIYIYNHIDKFIQSSNYIAIPLIYLRIHHFNTYYNKIVPNIITKFEDKKFCLQVSFNRSDHCEKFINNNNNILNKLKNIGKVDSIRDYNHRLNNTTCYQNKKLISLFNEYKFIYCYENSFTNGYITEKIFNAFFSRSIPIYGGPIDTNIYFNKESYISVNDSDIYTYIEELNNNKDKYTDIINKTKINNTQENDYIKYTNEFIHNYFEL